MKIGIKILPRAELLDTQGRAVEAVLVEKDFPIKNCRVGRYIVLDIRESDQEKALNQAKAMAEFVLFNPLTESFELEVLGGD